MADYGKYLADHVLVDTTILPRPIVAAAMARHTDWSGAPLGSASVLFSA
jgi:hypothetical protein